METQSTWKPIIHYSNICNKDLQAWLTEGWIFDSELLLTTANIKKKYNFFKLKIPLHMLLRTDISFLEKKVSYDNPRHTINIFLEKLAIAKTETAIVNKHRNFPKLNG